MNYKELLDGKKSLNLIVMVCMTKRDHQLFLYGYYSSSSCLSPGHSMGEKAALQFDGMALTQRSICGYVRLITVIKNCKTKRYINMFQYSAHKLSQCTQAQPDQDLWTQAVPLLSTGAATITTRNVPCSCFNDGVLWSCNSYLENMTIPNAMTINPIVAAKNLNILT